MRSIRVNTNLIVTEVNAAVFNIEAMLRQSGSAFTLYSKIYTMHNMILLELLKLLILFVLNFEFFTKYFH